MSFLGQKKKLLFPEIRVTRKIFTRTTAIFFKSIFWRYSLFFFSLFCFFCILVFFACSFIFWNQKYIFWYTFDSPGGWLTKKFSPGWFPETRLLFWGLSKIVSLYVETLEKAFENTLWKLLLYGWFKLKHLLFTTNLHNTGFSVLYVFPVKEVEFDIFCNLKIFMKVLWTSFCSVAHVS